MIDARQDPPAVNATDGLIGWMLEYLRPYRARVALLAVLLVSEIGLGALAPWPLAVVIDYVLGRLDTAERRLFEWDTGMDRIAFLGRAPGEVVALAAEVPVDELLRA